MTQNLMELTLVFLFTYWKVMYHVQLAQLLRVDGPTFLLLLRPMATRTTTVRPMSLLVGCRLHHHSFISSVAGCTSAVILSYKVGMIAFMKIVIYSLIKYVG
jgi:hypothetical protein